MRVRSVFVLFFGLLSLSVCLHASQSVLRFDVYSANLTYFEQAVAYTVQGLVNSDRSKDGFPLVFVDTGALNFQYPKAEAYWRDYLTQRGAAEFHNVSSTNDGSAATLCELVEAARPSGALAVGVVRYSQAYNHTLFLALTIAGLHNLLPVSAEVAARHPCLAALPVTFDVSTPEFTANKTATYEWAVTHLLPNTSRSVLYNGNVCPTAKAAYTTSTLMSLDYPLSQRAFALNLCPVTPHTPQDADTRQYLRIVRQQEDLGTVYGWSDPEFDYLAATSMGSNALYCTIATPNLSFWARLRGANVPAVKPLPRRDSRGLKLDRSKRYVTFFTNEGDTPRIVTSLMSSIWLSPKRGQVPLAWGIDPLLTETFPALFAYYGETARANDSFFAGVSGAAYVQLASLPDGGDKYIARAGQLMAKHGPYTADLYGECQFAANYTLLASRNGGRAPGLYICHNSTAFNTRANPYDRTPVVGEDGKLFYYLGAAERQGVPAAKFVADAIRADADARPAPFFYSVYGGLPAVVSTIGEEVDLNQMAADVMAELGSGYLALTSDEMARLAREALAVVTE